MKYRSFAFLILSALVFGLGASTFADSKLKKGGGSELVALLPASDGVLIIDARRFFNDALPKLLSSNQLVLEQVTGHMEKFRETTGIDIRNFESIAAGVKTRKISEKNYDVQPVIVARGDISSASLIAAAKIASKGKYTEQRVGDRTIYIFDAPKDANAARPDMGSMHDKIALTAVDSTTIAFGTPVRVRETLEGTTKVGTDIIGLLGNDPTAVTSFAMKMPAGMKSFLPIENDDLGKNIDSIQYMFGSADISGDVASVHMTARTLQSSQAKSLHETLSGLQMLGKAFLGGAKGPDKEAFARMIGNTKISVKGNDVSFDLIVPQTDIDILVGSIKTK